MIGNTVKFKDYCDEIFTAKVVGVFSDKFDAVKFENATPMEWRMALNRRPKPSL